MFCLIIKYAFLQEDNALPFSSLDLYTNPEKRRGTTVLMTKFPGKFCPHVCFLPYIPETISLFSFPLPLGENKIATFPSNFTFLLPSRKPA